jgi:two-component system phosphate regulon response regulator PhoB
LRNIVFRFDGSPAFARALREGDQVLALPRGETVAEGEWVLAMFEVGAQDRRRATASSARGVARGAGAPVLAFERRDWERLVDFAEAGSLPMIPAAKPASLPTRPPIARSLSPSQSAMSVPPARGSSPTGVASKLPPARGSSPSLSAVRAMRASLTGPGGAYARVLVVDDEPETCEIVGAMLEAVGLSVDAVHSAEEALDRLRAGDHDLLVLDWDLPGMNGVELCRVLRKDPALAMLPILFLSARAASQDVVEAFAAGADDYVSKPFRAPELGARIFALLRRARLVPASPA